MVWVPVFLFVLALCGQQGHGLLKLSSYFADHMVLQRAPQQAVMWGTAGTEGDTVSITLSRQGAPATQVSQVSTTVTQGKWKVKLPAQTDKGPYVINVKASDGHVILRDVLYGDVWLCSGQSNMYFSLKNVINGSSELQTAHNFPDVRITRVKLTQNTTAQDHVDFDIRWTGPNSRIVAYSSAVCWLFGEYLYSKVQHPIGLVESAWGGTPIEAWSPPEALTSCAQHRTKRGPTAKSVLFNGMINPILSTTIFGAIWYQGESNSGHYAQYSCQIQAMVEYWRSLFHQNSLQQTAGFPFGYVQLAGHVNSSVIGSFPYERWAQTANYGYSPNPALPNTFMAVAMDLPDYSSPYGTIHPRYKQDVAHRLVRGALNVGYGWDNVTHQGPFPTRLTKDAAAPHSLSILYDNGNTPLTVNNNQGFQVCCSATNTSHCDALRGIWVDAPIASHHDGQVTVSTSACGTRHVVGVRYEWRTSPCDYKQCSLYSASSGLPAPPYISLSLVADNNPEPIG